MSPLDMELHWQAEGKVQTLHEFNKEEGQIIRE